jgi:hypothetical protein
MVKGNAWVSMILAAALGCSSSSDPPAPGPGATGGSGSNPGSTGGSGGGSPPGNGGDTGTVAACTVLESTTVTNAPGASTRPAIAWTGSAYLLVWADQRDGGSDLFMTTLDMHGGRAGGAADVKIAHMATPLGGPELARLSDGHFMVVFETCASPACDDTAMGVGAVVLGPDGQPSGAPLELVGQAAVQRRPYVVAAFGGAYATFRDLDGATIVPRVLPLGTTGAASGAPVTMGGGAEGLYPHLAAGGDRLALVYRKSSGTPDIVLALLDQSLAVKSELPVRTGIAADATNPVAAWNGGGWTVAWEDQSQGPDPFIMGTAATPDNASAFPPATVSEGNGNWPAIASNGRNTFVAYYGFAGGAQIMLARLDNAGRRAGDVLQVSAEPAHGKYPTITHNEVDDELGVAWQDEGSGEIGFARVKCP